MFISFKSVVYVFTCLRWSACSWSSLDHFVADEFPRRKCLSQTSPLGCREPQQNILFIAYCLLSNLHLMYNNVETTKTCPVTCTHRFGALCSWWRHQMETFPRYWPCVREIHRSPANSPHKGQWRGALIFSLIYEWTNVWVNNWNTGDLRRNRAHCYVTVKFWRDYNTSFYLPYDSGWLHRRRKYCMIVQVLAKPPWF